MCSHSQLLLQPNEFNKCIKMGLGYNFLSIICVILVVQLNLKFGTNWNQSITFCGLRFKIRFLVFINLIWNGLKINNGQWFILNILSLCRLAL